MKKRILVLLVALFVLSSALWAGMNTILSIKPFYTGNNIPEAGYQSDNTWSDAVNPDTWNNLNNDWWMKRQDYWLQAYDKTSFLDIGFAVNDKGFNMVARFDIMQDVLPNLQNPGKMSTNIPFIGNLLDLTFPRVGFVDYTTPNGSFFFSLGRRLIKWGPGTYDLTISDSQPFLDNFYAEYRLRMINDWNFNYNYIIITPKQWMNYDIPIVQKTIFAHKFSFYNNNFKITVAELNNLYGKEPNLLDASPLIIWHDSNQDDYSNVLLHLILEGKVGPVRAFGGFSMDDFDLPHEGKDGISAKPQAMAFSAGVEYHVMDGEGIGDEKFDRRDYTIKEYSFKVENGLNIGFEWYYVSPLMYNRSKEDSAGKFTIPFQFISLTGSEYNYSEDAYYLGFKYGPNSQLFKLYGEYTNKPFDVKASAEVLIRGQYGIESLYGVRDKWSQVGISKETLMSIVGDKTVALLFDVDFAYYLQDAFRVQAGFEWQQDFTHKKSAYKLSLGVCLNPLDVDWKNLF